MSERIIPRIKQYLFISAIALTGIGLSFLFFTLTRGWELKQVNERFRNSAILHTEILKQEIGLNLFELNEIRAFFNSSREVTGDEFASFVDTILTHHPDISMLAWAPKMTPHGGEVSFPVTFVEPSQASNSFRGFDLASDSALLSHLERSWESGKMVGTDDIPNIRRIDETLDYLVVLPVYGKRVNDRSGSKGYANLQGFIVGLFNCRGVISESLASLTSKGINSEIFSLERGGKRIASKIWPSAEASGHVGARKDFTDPGGTIRYKTDIDLAGYRLRIVCTPSAGFMKANTTVHPQAIFVIGLLFTLSLVIYMLVIWERNARIRNYALGLEKSEERFRGLVENSLTGIFIVQKGEVVFKNREQETLVKGLPHTPFETEFKGFHPDDRKSFKQIYDRISSGSVQSLATELRYFPSVSREEKRSMKWIFCRGSSIEYRGDKAFLFNMIDITSAKELELRQRDKMASLGRMASVIAHEIRSPLSGINIYLNTLRKMFDRDAQNGKIHDIVGKIQSASDKIEGVMRRSMDFSRPGKAKFELNDMNIPVNDAISLLSSSLKSKRIEIEKTLDENLPKLYSDPRLIEQVVINLINNAIEAMESTHDPKIISISTTSSNNHSIVLSISDSGPGIPAEERNLIFEPYFSTKSENTGLGLSICNRIIVDHGGSITLSDSRWGGTTFMIKLPLEKRMNHR